MPRRLIDALSRCRFRRCYLVLSKMGQGAEVADDDRRVREGGGPVFQAAGVAIPPTVRQVEPVTPGEEAAHSATPQD